MSNRRTTLAADPDDLALLEAKARRRGVSLHRSSRCRMPATAWSAWRRTRNGDHLTLLPA